MEEQRLRKIAQATFVSERNPCTTLRAYRVFKDRLTIDFVFLSHFEAGISAIYRDWSIEKRIVPRATPGGTSGDPAKSCAVCLLAGVPDVVLTSYNALSELDVMTDSCGSVPNDYSTTGWVYSVTNDRNLDVYEYANQPNELGCLFHTRHGQFKHVRLGSEVMDVHYFSPFDL